MRWPSERSETKQYYEGNKLRSTKHRSSPES